jgi:FixJ family two-component response regulator
VPSKAVDGRHTIRDTPGFSAVAETAKVYIVDDDAMFARGLARLVGAAGWQVEVFNSADEFLGAVIAGNPGCVLLDVRMPGMKGPELYRTMLARDMRLPVIFLTAHGDVPTSVDVMKMGAVDFLEKPVSGDVLVGTIRVAIARGEQERSRERALEMRALRAAVAARGEVMQHVIAGRLNKQIAAELGISVKTVKAHRARSCRRCRRARFPSCSRCAAPPACRDQLAYASPSRVRYRLERHARRGQLLGAPHQSATELTAIFSITRAMRLHRPLGGVQRVADLLVQSPATTPDITWRSRGVSEA